MPAASAAGAEALAAAGIDAGHARRQGGPGADQRHRRDARHARAGRSRPRACCCDIADVAAALSVEALLGTDRVFAARPPRRCARTPARRPARRNLRALLAGSAIDRAIAPPTARRVQDAYSLRCAPQVHGAARDTLDHARAGRRPRAGRRDRQPGRAARRPGGVERQLPRRAARLRAGLPRHRGRRRRAHRRAAHRPPARRVPHPRLPAFLADDPGVDSGLMIAQYTAAAWSPRSSGSPHRPASTRSRRSAMQEDHVSMGWHAARKLRRAVDGARAPSSPSSCSPPPGAAPARAAGAGSRLCGRARSAGRAGTGRSRPRPPPGAGDRRRHRTRPLRCRAGRGGTRHREAVVTPMPDRPRRRTPPSWPSHLRPAAGTGSGRAGPWPVRAARGTALTARSWQTEAPLRMLMNNLDPEVAERPDDSSSTAAPGRRPRDWASFDAIVRTLTTLDGDETLLVQSGRPVGVMRTHEWAPRVLIANSNLVGDWATWPEFRRLEHLGLTMLRADDRRVVDLHRHPGDPPGHLRDLRRGRGRPRGEVRRHARRCRPDRHAHRHRGLRRDGRCAAAGRHPERGRLPDHRRRPGPAAPPGATRYLDEVVDGVVPDGPAAATSPALDEALRRVLAARAARRALSWPGRQLRDRAARTAAPRRPGGLRHRPDQRARPAVLPARGRRPRGLARLRRGQARSSPTGPGARWPGTCRRWSASWTPAPRSSTTATRSGTRPGWAGSTGRSTFPGFVPAYIRPLFCEGKGPFRWVALSGDPRDIAATDSGDGAVPRRRPSAPVDARRAGAGRLPGPAGAHLLAGLRRA